MDNRIIKKATMPCPVCRGLNETSDIEIMLEQDETTVKLCFYCPECGTEHTEKLHLIQARKKFGKCFGCILNTGEFIARPECGGCDGNSNFAERWRKE